jgi:hypothetical protein
MNKRLLSERDICTKFITPALQKAGWDELLSKFPRTQLHQGPPPAQPAYARKAAIHSRKHGEGHQLGNGIACGRKVIKPQQSPDPAMGIRQHWKVVPRRH